MRNKSNSVPKIIVVILEDAAPNSQLAYTPANHSEYIIIVQTKTGNNNSEWRKSQHIGRTVAQEIGKKKGLPPTYNVRNNLMHYSREGIKLNHFQWNLLRN